MRRALVFVFLAACADRPVRPSVDDAPWSDAWLVREASRFLNHPESRRAFLEDSLTNPDNAYAHLRLVSYGKGDGWDLLPEWNPDGLWDGQMPQSMDAWVALGRKAFFGYPMRADPFVEHALARPELAAAAGLEPTGLVTFTDVDGQRRTGLTCAACHAAVRDGVVVAGAARRTFDYGKLRVSVFDDRGEAIDPKQRARMLRWGPGRADVTEDDDEDPVAIPDLWGIKAQRFLTSAGTLRHDSPFALAIRQDTQLTDSNNVLVRPPRVIPWALAMFVYSLTPPASPAPPSPRGEAVFARHCGTCHSNAVYGGRLIPAEVIGTDPALATGRGRGTGFYRTPALLDVRHGAPYLHDGSVKSLAELLDGTRASPGHRAGTDLGADDRTALLAFLQTL